MRSAAISVGLICAVSFSAIGIAATSGSKSTGAETRTMTGWFSDAQCAAPRVEKGIIGPNNPECVKKCLSKGVAPVFVSEQTKALYEVQGYPSVAADVGWYVEVVGTIVDGGRKLSVASVKRLEESGPMCTPTRKTP